MDAHDNAKRGQRMFGEKTVQYVHNGEVIAEDETDLAEWIREECEYEFEEWLNEEYSDFEVYTNYLTPSEILNEFRDYYREEMDHWIVDIVLPDPIELEALDIQIVEVLPPEDREYTIEPYTEPWTVRGEDVRSYYDDAGAMEVGDVYDQGTFRVVRTKNARKKRGMFR